MREPGDEPRGGPPPRRTLLAWLLGGVFLGMLGIALLVYAAASTPQGHERVLAFTLRQLGKNVQGTLEVERVEGNLLTGARLYGVALRAPDGDPFVLADSAYLDYALPTLLTARIRIEEAVLFDPEVYVRRLPGDSLWNYQKIFRDTSTVARPPGAERHTYLDRVRLVDARARIQIPWEPDTAASPRARRREVAEALADTSPVLVHRVPGGFLRTVNFTGVHARLSQVRFAPGTEAGTSLAIDSLSATVQFFRDPFRVVEMAGRVLVLDAQAHFEAPVIRLPDSRLAAAGVVRFPEGAPEPLYDVAVVGEEVALRDLQWLYPRFPRQGDARGTFLIETRPEGTLFLFRDAVLTAPGTRLAGDFGMVLGDTLRFVDVEVEADPIRVETVEQMLPQELPVVGLEIGSAGVRGIPDRAAQLTDAPGSG